MNSLSSAVTSLLSAALFCSTGHAAEAQPPDGWTAGHDQLVQRLRNLSGKEGAFGPAYRPLYHAALPWYELWGGRDRNPVDADMVAPEAYASNLADALEHGHNYFAENPGALFPLVFEGKSLDGTVFRANYWLRIPVGFPTGGRTFPLVIDLHGSGWLGHKISFKRSGRSPDETFNVTPINMGGPWNIDFLNAYLDELISILPVDTDRVYVQGHSLGAMATWEWALDNPERFAAISPRAGVGEPYRASRLKNVPSWVIHGENDKVIPSGFADQMVAALQSEGAGVRFSIIRRGEHNMPGDLDQRQVLDWYLKKTRSHLPPPPDPRDALGINGLGYSRWEVINVPETMAWSLLSVEFPSTEAFRNGAGVLFQRAHDRGEMVDSPVREEIDLETHVARLWLAEPKTLHVAGSPDASVVAVPAKKMARFFYRGETQKALDHLQSIRPEIEAAGHTLSRKVWVTSLSIWRDSPNAVAEYWLEID
jgi:hypothetical protein